MLFSLHPGPEKLFIDYLMRSTIDPRELALEVEISECELGRISGELEAFKAGARKLCFQNRLRCYIVWTPDGAMLAGEEL